MPLVPLRRIWPKFIQTSAIPRRPLVLAKRSFCMGFGAHRRARGGGLLPCAGETGDRLVAIPDFSHGFLVPIFAAYLVWAKRKTLSDTKIAPTWSGIAVVALGLMVLLLGVYGAELFLSRVSLVILLAGLVLCFGGWQLLKELRFALAGPAPGDPDSSYCFQRDHLPLQFLASKLASALLPFFGVPVLREGNIIELPAMKLEVAEACSGIRSLVSLFTLVDLLWVLPGEVLPAAGHSRFGQHSDRDCGQRGAHSRHRSVRPVLGSGQGHGLLSRVLRLGHVSGVSGVPFHRPSRHGLHSGQKEAGMKSPRFWTVVAVAGRNCAAAVRPRQYRSDSR